MLQGKLFECQLLLLVEVHCVTWNFGPSIIQNVVSGFLRNQMMLLCLYEQLLEAEKTNLRVSYTHLIY